MPHEPIEKLVSVKCPEKEYRALKAFSRQCQQFVHHHLALAIRQYLASKKMRP